jgi:hypothetical protein
MLVLDSFCGHITEKVKAEVNEDSHLLIPSGLIRFCSLWMLSLISDSRSLFAALQPVNATMKCELTPSSRMKCVPLSAVCEWILAA